MLLLAAVAFAQASLAFSACQLERGRLAQAIGVSDERPCDDGVVVAKDWTKYTNRCLAHCTADLQTTGGAVALVRNPAVEPVLLLERMELLPVAGTRLEIPPLGAPPMRILLHSFLI